MDINLETDFNVVLFHENQRVGDILASSINIYTNQKCISYDQFEPGVQHLKSSSKLDVVITSLGMKQGRSLDEILAVYDAENENHLIICLDEISNQEKYPNVKFLTSDDKVKEVISFIAKKKGITAQMMADLDVGAFYPISKSLLIPGLYLDVDLYSFYLSNYILIFSKGQTISKDAIMLIQNTYSELYVQSSDRLCLINKVSEKIKDLLSSKKVIGVERVTLTKTAFEIVQETASSIGISDKTMYLADATIDSMKGMVKKSRTLSKLLNVLLSNEDSYKYQHSMITMYIGTKIIEDVEWKSDEFLKKLGFVAMFSDITLSDKLSRIQTEFELENSGLTEHEKDLIENHAVRAAKLLSRFKRVPLGVDSLVKAHHGSKTGVGLTMNTMNIAPVGLIFMISSDFAANIIKAKETNTTIDKEEFHKYLLDKYGKNPKFREYIGSFEQIKLN